MSAGRYRQAALLVGVVGLIAAALAWAFDPTGFYRAWLPALVFVLGLPIGAMSLIFVHAMAGGGWGAEIGPQLRAIAVSLPFLLIAIVPILIGMPWLYPWTHPEEAATLTNRFWLERPFFIGRTIFYAVVWLGLAWAAQAPIIPRPRAAIAMMLLALTWTFAGIDWTLSRYPHWFSTAYGMMWLSRDALDAVTLATLMRLAVPPAPGRPMVSDLAKLMLGGVMLWSYLVFMQFLIVWESDLSDEIPWYIDRTSRGWAWVAGFAFFATFLLPFFLLLGHSARSWPRRVAAVGALLLAGRVAYIWWLAAPPASFNWADPAALAAVAGLGWWLMARVRPITVPAEPHLARLRHG